MFNVKIRAASILFMLLFACVGSRAQQGYNGLVVEVKTVAGQPLKKVCVTVIPREGEITLLKTDREGKVKLKRLSPGSYRVVVRVDGYEAQKKVVAIGQSVETVAFQLEPRAGLDRNE